MKKFALALIGMAVAASSWAGFYDFSASLSGIYEVPPNNSQAYGAFSVRVNDVTWQVTGLMIVEGISMTNFRASHIHEAPSNANGPVRFDIVANSTITPVGNYIIFDINGTLPGTQAQRQSILNAMLAGNTYVNVHTAQFPGGEIRGQLCPVPEPGTMAALGLGALALLRRRRK